MCVDAELSELNSSVPSKGSGLIYAFTTDCNGQSCKLQLGQESVYRCGGCQMFYDCTPGGVPPM